jgi:hypothetical protein
LTETDKLYGLAFSIAQILEHTPLDELSGSFLFMIFANIMLHADLAGTTRQYEWGSRTPNVNAKDLKDFMTAHKLPRVTQAVLPIAAPTGMNHPEFYVGAKLYCYFLMFKQPNRYNWVNYDKIYTIRQNIPLVLGTDYTVAAAAVAPRRAAAAKKVLRGKRKEVVVVEEAAPRRTRRGARAELAAAAEESLVVPSVSAKVAAARARAAEYQVANAAVAAPARRTLRKKRGGHRTRRNRH